MNIKVSLDLYIQLQNVVKHLDYTAIESYVKVILKEEVENFNKPALISSLVEKFDELPSGSIFSIVDLLNKYSDERYSIDLIQSCDEIFENYMIEQNNKPFIETLYMNKETYLNTYIKL